MPATLLGNMAAKLTDVEVRVLGIELARGLVLQDFQGRVPMSTSFDILGAHASRRAVASLAAVTGRSAKAHVTAAALVRHCGSASELVDLSTRAE